MTPQIYMDYGWAVFPLSSNSKIPLKGSQGCKDATKNINKIQPWWGKCNLALATGSYSGVFVVDIDVKNGKNGFETWTRNGYDELPATVEQITPSGGVQKFFNYPDGVHIGNDQSGKLGDGLDIRGEGGYVCLPPSSVNSKKYEWVTDQSPGEIAIADAPQWLIDIISEVKKEPFKLPDGPVPQGTQDDTMFKMACSLRKSNLPDHLIEESLRAALKKCPQDPKNPFTDADIKRWMTSSGRYDYSGTAEWDSVGYKNDDKIPVLNDTYNAEIFVSMHRGKLIYCDALQGWHIFNGQYWKRDGANEIKKYCDQTYQQMKREWPEWVPKLDPARQHIAKKDMTEEEKADAQTRQYWLTHVRKSGNMHAMGAMAEVSKKDLSVEESFFDRDPNLLCLKNGVYDLRRHVFKQFNPNDYLTRQAGVAFDSAAKCPQWERFLDVIFLSDRELIRYVQKLFGYCLTADVTRQIFVICHGGGSNGKSTMFQTLQDLLGDYAQSISINTLLNKDRSTSIPNDIAALRGARFVMANETEKSRSLDSTVIKEFTSTHPIQARFLHKEFFSFVPTFKAFLLTNPLPRIRANDDGTWRRIRKIPFNHKFDESEKIVDFQERVLQPELTGIFNWCVDGLKMLNKEGEKVPDIVRMSTADYRSCENEIGLFLEEHTEKDSDVYMLTSTMWQYYVHISGIEKNKYHLSKHNFYQELEINGIKSERITRRDDKNRYKRAFFGLKPIYNFDMNIKPSDFPFYPISNDEQVDDTAPWEE